jgi:hypothetical protein
MEARGRPVPDELQPPDILPGYGEWISAFWYLSRDRQSGGPLPASSIDRYAAGLCAGEGALFRSVMLALDDVYLRHIHPDNGGGESVESARDAFRGTMDAHFEGRKA